MTCFKSRFIVGFLALNSLCLFAGSALAGTVDVIFWDNRIGTLDDATGAYTNIGTLPVNVSSGIASINGLLYVEDSGSDLYSVDPTTAASHLIGMTGIGDNSAAFAGGPGGLFEVDHASNLYSVSTTTGTGKLIGATGIKANNGNYDTSLSLNGTSLFFTMGSSGSKDELYQINTVTGLATDLGTTGVTGVAGSALVNGKLELYQYGQSSNYIYSAPAGSINFAQGAQLTAQIIDGGTILNSAGTGNTQALSTSTPEPDTLLLIGSGLILIGPLRRILNTRLKRARTDGQTSGFKSEEC